METVLLERMRLRSRQRRECESDILKFTAAIRQDPGDVDAYYQRGQAFRRKGELIPAVCDFNAALRLEPTHTPSLFYKGVTCGLLGNRYEEVRAYRLFLAHMGREHARLAEAVRRRVERLETDLPPVRPSQSLHPA